VAVVAFLWGRAAWMSFWLDEGISVGVASHPLRSIPQVLLQDGSPPLYYALLHVWTSVFGSSEAATHLLSLLFALATVAAAFWAGWTLFDRRTAWLCALVVAINPFVAYYATETRMYSMAVLLGLLSTATFLHAFVFGRRRYLPWFVLTQTLLMYTHNWGLLLAAGFAVALVACTAFLADRRRVLVDAVLGFGGIALLYAPWVPSLIYQVTHDLQPWGRRADLVWVRDAVGELFGGNEAFVALGLGAGIGLAALLQGRGWTRAAVAVLVLALVPLVTLGLGWRVSVWAYRYLAVAVGPLVLLASVGLARGGRVAVAALGVAAFLSAPIALRGPEYQKSNAEAVAAAVSPRLQTGDLVISPDFQMVPLLAQYLPPGLRYATTSGVVPDEDVVDWRGSMDRLLGDDPADTLPPLIEALPPGAHVLVACPPGESDAESIGLAQDDGGGRASSEGRGETRGGASVQATTTPPSQDVTFHPLILVRCRETQELVTNHPQLEVNEVLTAPDGVLYTAVDAVVLTKRPAPLPA
jgi:mannosyltransferase